MSPAIHPDATTPLGRKVEAVLEAVAGKFLEKDEDGRDKGWLSYPDWCELRAAVRKVLDE